MNYYNNLKPEKTSPPLLFFRYPKKWKNLKKNSPEFVLLYQINEETMEIFCVVFEPWKSLAEKKTTKRLSHQKRTDSTWQSRWRPPGACGRFSAMGNTYNCSFSGVYSLPFPFAWFIMNIFARVQMHFKTALKQSVKYEQRHLQK